MSASPPHRLHALAPAAAALVVVAAVAGASLSRAPAGEEVLVSDTTPSPDATLRLSSAEAGATEGHALADTPSSDTGSHEGAGDPEQAGAADVRSPVSQSVEIVVALKDANAIKPIADAFFKDPAQGRRAYDVFRTRHPAFAGLALDRVTYSSELVLTPVKAPAAGKALVTAREIAARLSAAPDVAYAEPNLIAKPGTK
jgi:hypothetical protein